MLSCAASFDLPEHAEVPLSSLLLPVGNILYICSVKKSRLSLRYQSFECRERSSNLGRIVSVKTQPNPKFAFFASCLIFITVLELHCISLPKRKLGLRCKNGLRHESEISSMCTQKKSKMRKSRFCSSFLLHGVASSFSCSNYLETWHVKYRLKNYRLQSSSAMILL